MYKKLSLAFLPTATMVTCHSFSLCPLICIGASIGKSAIALEKCYQIFPQKAIRNTVCAFQLGALFSTSPKARSALPYSFHYLWPKGCRYYWILLALIMVTNKRAPSPIVIHEILNLFKVGSAPFSKHFGFQILHSFVLEI